ncbi:peptidoglycan-associated lipoprotein [Gammaproteobacteria bacterium]
MNVWMLVPLLIVLSGCTAEQIKSTLENVKPTGDGTELLNQGITAPEQALDTDVYRPTDKMVDEFNNPTSLLSKRVLYFDRDQTNIRPEYKAVLEAHGKYLSKHTNALIILEGHTDEMGSREYNLALGEKRSQTVRQTLLLNGATTAQIEVVSYGEERPAKAGQEEASWQLNRRVEILYRR